MPCSNKKADDFFSAKKNCTIKLMTVKKFFCCCIIENAAENSHVRQDNKHRIRFIIFCWQKFFIIIDQTADRIKAIALLASFENHRFMTDSVQLWRFKFPRQLQFDVCNRWSTVRWTARNHQPYISRCQLYSIALCIIKSSNCQKRFFAKDW